ncbi:MAG: hypothetical protein ACE5E1_03190 [Phycisphaerae bacterium]
MGRPGDPARHQQEGRKREERLCYAGRWAYDSMHEDDHFCLGDGLNRATTGEQRCT